MNEVEFIKQMEINLEDIYLNLLIVRYENSLYALVIYNDILYAHQSIDENTEQYCDLIKEQFTVSKCIYREKYIEREDAENIQMLCTLWNFKEYQASILMDFYEEYFDTRYILK